jgi:NAD(P)-dependent dehydrogenase (short-subunit alcohol dehydrogenase family)
MRLDDQVVIVTGGGSGIGTGIATTCASRGASVAVVDMDGVAAQRVADDIDAVGGSSLAITADVTKASDIHAMVDATRERFGRITGLVNNAGILVEGTVGELSDDGWDRVLAVNLTAPFRLTRAVIPHLRAAGGGAIVNISSIEGLAAGARHVAYSASKAGLLNLTRATAIDHGREGIRANAICPGSVETPLYEDFLAGHHDPGAVRAQLIERNFANRLGLPSDIGSVVVFLLSDDASFVNGAAIVVDGGRMVKVP